MGIEEEADQKQYDRAMRVGAILRKFASEIAPKAGTVDVDGITNDLWVAWHLFAFREKAERRAEPGSEARKRLLDLAKSAHELISSFEALGPTARAMIVAVAQRFDLGDTVDGMDLGMFPDPSRPESSCGWIDRLEALEDTAQKTADHIHQKSGNGGRTSFRARVLGTPEDGLAEECWKIAGVHGCQSEATVLKMVQAIMEVERGKDAMTRMGGEHAAYTGRNAVRKLTQTPPKTGTV